MNFEKELNQLADQYRGKGYEVTVRPGPEALPPFARDFKVELLAKRAGKGVLVSVKQNRTAMAADAELPRYASVIGQQKDWRFDFAILEAEDPRAKEMQGAQELPDEDVIRALGDADGLVQSGLLRPALTTAWAGFEAAMRRRLVAMGEKAGWESWPRQMLAELYSAGLISFEDFPRLEKIYRLRNEAVHGFASPNLDADAVQLLTGTARRLLKESHPENQRAY